MSYDRLFWRYFEANGTARHYAKIVDRYTKLFDQVIAELESRQGSEDVIKQLRATQQEILADYGKVSINLEL